MLRRVSPHLQYTYITKWSTHESSLAQSLSPLLLASEVSQKMISKMHNVAQGGTQCWRQRGPGTNHCKREKQTP